jgi:hypothetical protein
MIRFKELERLSKVYPSVGELLRAYTEAVKERDALKARLDKLLEAVEKKAKGK